MTIVGNPAADLARELRRPDGNTALDNIFRETLAAMTARTSVVVYAVDDSGATGARLGTATLVEPGFALIHPPLSTSLAERPRRLRLGVFNAEFDFGQVVDVTTVSILDDAPDVVLAQLARPSLAPAHGVAIAVATEDGQPTREDGIAALRAVLADVAATAAAQPPSAVPIGNLVPWLLKFLGGG